MINSNRFFAVASVFTLVGLLADLAAASETVSASSETVCEVVESECRDVALEQDGREGETVRVCERVQLVCSERAQ